MGSLNKIKRPWELQKQYNNQQGQGRKVINPFYQTRQWKVLRDAFKKGYSTHLPGLVKHHNALCWICALDGRTTPTHTVDHMKPINPLQSFETCGGKYGEPLLWENLGPLCKQHADRKNALERQHPDMSLNEKVKRLRIVQ